MIAKRLSLTLALLLVSSLGLSHWYSIRQIDSPPTEQRTTTYRCIDSTGITVATNQTFAASEQACGALATQRGGVFYIEEHDSIARVTRTHEIRGSTSLKVTAAEASLIVVNGGAGSGPPSGGGGGFDPGSPIFFDDFDYVVTNDIGDATANLAAFVAAGWENAASDNITGGRGGNLYTAVPADVPGHSGAFPGSTQRALVINSNAGTLGTQTDFWLEYGSTIGDIPANVYFQFWVYVARSGAQMSAFHGREKFIYPTRNSYPATSGNNGGHWLFELSTNSYPPDSVDVAAAGQAFSLLRDSTISSSTPYYDNQDAIDNGLTGSLGQNLSTTPLFAPNQWVEVRLHFDTSTATGIHEAWRRVVGEDWVKVTEWISGTPVAGDDFTWNIDASFRDGHQTIRMPTTMPASNSTGTVNSWIYMQDFAMADDVNDLPTYDGY